MSANAESAEVPSIQVFCARVRLRTAPESATMPVAVPPELTRSEPPERTSTTSALPPLEIKSQPSVLTVVLFAVVPE